MKQQKPQPNPQNHRHGDVNPRPDTRDNLDSRKRKEEGYDKDKDDTNKEDKKKYDKNE